MSLTNFQNNRVVHRNDTSSIQLANDNNTLTKSTNDKLDSQITQQTAVNTKLDQLSGAINNNIGDGSVKLQTYVYGHDSGNGLARPLAVTSNGELKVSNDVLEVSAETVNLNTDTLEAKIQATNDKLDSLSGAGNNNVGEGSTKLQTYLYARDVSAGNFKPLVCDGDAHLQVDVLSTALPTGGATETTLSAVKNALFTNPAGTGNTAGENLSALNTNLISMNNKFVGGATTSGMATAQNQQTIDLTLQGIDSSAGNIETAVQLMDDVVTVQNASHPNKANAVGGRYYVDNTFRDIRVDNIGKVIIDTPSGSDLHNAVDGTRKALFTDPAGTGLTVGENASAINQNLITQNANQINGNAVVKVMGSEDASTSGTQRQLHVNSSGQIQIDPAVPVSVGPSNSFNSDNASHVNSFAVGIRGRTDVTDHSTGKFLLCDSNGRLAVINKTGVVNHSEVSYVSGQSVSGSGTHTGASITVDANTKAFYVEHNFSHAGIKYEILASIDGTNFFSTGTEFNAGGLSPATLTGINTIKGSSGTAEGFPPFIKFKFSNSDSSVQSATLSYVQQIS